MGRRFDIGHGARAADARTGTVQEESEFGGTVMDREVFGRVDQVSGGASDCDAAGFEAVLGGLYGI